MNTLKSKKLIWPLIAAIVLSSCWNPEDFDKFAIEPFHQSWVFPLVNSNISFREIVERSGSNTTVETNPETGVFFMAIRDTLDIGLASGQFALSGISFSYNIGPTLVPGFGSTPLTTYPLEENYAIAQGQEIKLLHFHDGEMQLNIVNNYQHPVAGSIKISSLKNSAGDEYIRTFNLGGLGSNSTDSRDLTGYRFDLFKSPNQYNVLKIEISFQITENTLATNYSGGLSVDLDFINPEFELIYGKFNQNFSIPNQTFYIGAFNSTLLAEQYFADPSFELIFENSYGTPLSLAFTAFNATNNLNQSFPVVNEGTFSPGDLDLSGSNALNYPLELMHPPATTSLILNADNSNIDSIFSHAPNKFLFGTLFTIGDATDYHDYFIKRESQVSLVTDIIIPLDGWATTHLLADTIQNIEWPNIKQDYKFLRDDYRVTLNFLITNELPLYLRFKAVCLKQISEDEYDEVYNLVFSDDIDPVDGTVPLTNSAVVDENGVAITPSSSSLSISLTKDEYELVQNSDNLLLFYRLFTGGTTHQPVKVLSTNKMNLKLSIQFSGTIDPNEPESENE
jgi:hypothetical protein